MSHFVEGGEYRGKNGQALKCVRRRFGGVLGEVELVTLATGGEEPDEAGRLRLAWMPWGERCASVVADYVHPTITDTLGGVYRSDMCEHRKLPKLFRRVLARGGPNDGRWCCSGCGGAVDAAEGE